MGIFKALLVIHVFLFLSCNPRISYEVTEFEDLPDIPVPVTPLPQTETPQTDPPQREMPVSRYSTIDLTFLGDLMAHTPNFRMIDYARIYSRLGSILLDDCLTFVNLETVLDPGKPYATYPRFNVHEPYVWAAIEAGVDVFSLANNHTNDHGLESSFKTLDSMRNLRTQLVQHHPDRPGLWWSGIRDEVGQPFRVTSIEHRGWNIGFISMTHFLNDYSGSQGVYLVPFWDQPAQEAFLNLVERESPHYDLFIVAYHGGNEYVLEPPGYVQRFLDRLYRAGAHIVWGHHPHVIQPWQLQYDPDGHYITGLIMPSMGNFISGQTSRLGPDDHSIMRAYTGDSVILQVRGVKDTMTNKVFLEFPRVHYISTHNTNGETHIRFLKELIHELDGPWQHFFSVRYQAMEDLTRQAQTLPLFYARALAARYSLEE